MTDLKRYMSNPFVVTAICMVLFVVMYNNATNGFMRSLSYVPLLVITGIFVRGLYWAYIKNRNK